MKKTEEEEEEPAQEETTIQNRTVIIIDKSIIDKYIYRVPTKNAFILTIFLKNKN